jgi:hypothetical protein
MLKTREEVEKLKEAWLKDSWDDLETTEDYGEYFVELIKFRREVTNARAISAEKRHARLVKSGWVHVKC